MKISIFFCFLLTLLIVKQTSSLPIIDDIVKFGQKINNNQAVEALTLQIVPMSTRVKFLSFVKDLYQNLDTEKNAQAEKVVSFYNDEVQPYSKNTYNKISTKLTSLKNQVLNGKNGKEVEEGFHEYLSADS